MRAAIYARVSTTEQTVDNQLLELCRYIEARGWTAVNEYVDVNAYGGQAPFVTVQTLNMRPSANTIDAVAA